MEEGFEVDVGYGVTYASRWHPGAPRKSMWTGLKLDKKALREVVVWRCTACGFLESYAP
jgi:hypothetical protein